jgi:hypothetical protein
VRGFSFSRIERAGDLRASCATGASINLRPSKRFPVGLQQLSTVMPARVAGIHVFLTSNKTWMAGT